MESEKWIESLARQARLDVPPAIAVSVPSLAALRGSVPMGIAPRMLWFSGAAALAAACLMLAVGIYQQRSTSASSSNSNDSMSVLFSPLDAKL